MLVISRRVDQSIMIGDDIEILITDITRDGVRLGIRAPRETRVHRKEVFDAIADANRASATKKVPLQDAAQLLRSQLPQGKPPKVR